MRTKELWYEKLRANVIRRKFPPRIVKDLLEIPEPDIKEPEVSRYIWGKIKTGKTILACQLLLMFERNCYLQNKTYRTEYAVAIDMYEELTNTFHNKSELTSIEWFIKYAEADFLVIDDFGITKPTDYIYQTFYRLVNYRYEHMLPTIITSNLSLNQVSEVFGDDRITNRIARMGKITEKYAY